MKRYGGEFVEKLANIFVNPRSGFAAIALKPSWGGAYAVLSVITIVYVAILFDRTGSIPSLQSSMEASGGAQNGQNAAMVVAFYRYVAPILAPIGSGILFAGIALVFMVAFMVMGHEISFRQSMAVTVWGSFPGSAVMMLCACIVLSIREPGSADASRIIASNLGAFIERDLHPGLYELMTAIDVFNLWSLYLLIVGFVETSSKRLSYARTAMTVVSLWVLYVAARVAFAVMSRS